MTAAKRVTDDEPGDVEALLPWHAAGTLSARDIRRVEEALARDPDLAKQYAVIRDEYVETISLNESLGAPSVGALQKLFAAIDAEPALSVPIAPWIWRVQQGVGLWQPLTAACLQDAPCLLAGQACNINNNNSEHSFVLTLTGPEFPDGLYLLQRCHCLQPSQQPCTLGVSASRW